MAISQMLSRSKSHPEALQVKLLGSEFLLQLNMFPLFVAALKQPQGSLDFEITLITSYLGGSHSLSTNLHSPACKRYE